MRTRIVQLSSVPLLVVVTLTLVLVPVATPWGFIAAGGAVIGNDYPTNLASPPKDSLVDPWKFFNRECTSLVAWRLNHANGVAFNDYYGGPQWGNAENWGPTARALGIAVNSTPAVGSVAWDAGGVGGASGEGHVAWVANVETNGTVDVEEYNYHVPGGYDVRNGVSPSSFSGFIHIHDITPTSPTNGYWLVGSDGGIFSFGLATFYGSTGSLNLQRPVVSITPTATRVGYWLVASDGGIFSFGDAVYYGSIPGLGLSPADSSASRRLNAPIVGMVPSSDGKGYFMVASDGGVFAFGDATYAGSCPGIGGCFGTAVAVMPDATGNGYWVVTKTGGVYDFGDAPSFGPSVRSSSPVVSATRTPDGKGYWILASDGTVSPYGDAAQLGAPTGGVGGSDPAAAIFSTADGGGYWVTSALGGVSAFGDAPSEGGVSGTRLNGLIIAATGF
jgi:surface antigen